MSARGFFVTGTDTGIGKTLVSCALMHALRGRGLDVVPMKPIAAGAGSRDGQPVNDDTEALLLAAGLGGEWRETVTPMLLREPVAPHIAARIEGRAIDLDAIDAAFARLARNRHGVVVEGVGGFCVPLDDNEHDTVDLARRLALPVVLVVGLRLGCLNHALLTAQAIAHAKLAFAGWIANTIDAAMPFRDENIDTLRHRLAAPHLGTIPHMPAPDAHTASTRLAIEPLLAMLR